MFTQAQRIATIDVAKALPWFWSGPLLRPWHRHWGATAEEVRSVMPGDELLPHAHLEATRAISIAAPPEQVWSWIIQIGFHRAGFYAYDLLDNLGRPSASEIVPELQDIHLGDRVAMADPPNDTTAFRIARIEPAKALVWQKPDSTWAWRFDALPGGGTRLVTRLKQHYDLGRPVPALGSMALMEFGDFPMMRRLLQTVRTRAEEASVRDGRTIALPTDGAAISHWASPEAKAAYDAAYDASMALWPIPFEHREVEGPFGRTHVVVSGEPSGDPVVLIHAASLSAVQWFPQAASLGAAHRLYAIDIMGDIGRSTQAAPIHSRAAAAAWLSTVLEGLGITRAAFVGSSFGGFQAANLAVLRPDLVRSLALLAPAATVRPFRRMANAMIRTGSLVPLPMTVKPGLRGMMGGDLPDERLVRQMELGVAGFRYDRAGVYPTAFADDELAAIRCPTLLLLGDQEMIYDPMAAMARARRLIPRVTASIIPDVGHLLGMQRQDLVDPWIRELLDAPDPGAV